MTSFPRHKIIGAACLAGFVACVWLSNFLLTTFGVIDLPLLGAVPAGVFTAGLAFSMRDAVQSHLGRAWVFLGVAVGAALSFALSQAVVTPDGFVIASAMKVAIASAIAFSISELVDYGIYTPLRKRNLPAAVGLSNTVGALFDSVIFLSLAFGSLNFLQGQVAAKILVTLPVVGALAWRQHRTRAILLG